MLLFIFITNYVDYICTADDAVPHNTTPNKEKVNKKVRFDDEVLQTLASNSGEELRENHENIGNAKTEQRTMVSETEMIHAEMTHLQDTIDKFLEDFGTLVHRNMFDKYMMHFKRCLPTLHVRWQYKMLIEMFFNSWDSFFNQTAKIAEMMDSLMECCDNTEHEENAEFTSAKIDFGAMIDEIAALESSGNECSGASATQNNAHHGTNENALVSEYSDMTLNIKKRVQYDGFTDTTNPNYMNMPFITQNNITYAPRSVLKSRRNLDVKVSQDHKNVSLFDDSYDCKVSRRNNSFKSVDDHDYLHDDKSSDSELYGIFQTSNKEEVIYEQPIDPLSQEVYSTKNRSKYHDTNSSSISCSGIRSSTRMQKLSNSRNRNANSAGDLDENNFHEWVQEDEPEKKVKSIL